MTRGNTSLTADGDLSFSAQNINIESQQSLNLTAGTRGKLEASATLDITGATVNIN